MVDPDLEIRGKGGWGSGHSEPLDKGGVSKKIFSALRASVSTRNKMGEGGRAPPLAVRY